MKISDLIATLQNILEENGDLNVQIVGNDDSYTEMNFWYSDNTLNIELID